MESDATDCKFSRRAALICTAVAAAGAVTGLASLGKSAFDRDDPDRTWLRVRELVTRESKASELARQLAGNRVEVRGWEYVSSGKHGEFDLYDRPPVACGGCGLIHGPGATLRVVGAGRQPGNLKNSILIGELRISVNGEVALRLS